MNSDGDSGAPLPAATEESAILIPGLPNKVARTILSMVPYAHHARLTSTSKAWKSVLSSKSFLNTLLNRNHLIVWSVVLLRYDMSSNRWLYESHVPKKAPHGSAFSIVVVDGELYILTHLYDEDVKETRSYRHYKKTGTMCFQIYNPRKKTWRTLVTKSPFNYHLDINSAVLSSICL